MADTKPTDNNAKMIGGVNQKGSEYSLSKAQFLNLRNLDFDVPNALQKRPGSTQGIVARTSGPVTSIHEFVKLNGASTIVVGTDTALFYMNAATLQPLDLGWSNGQPVDALTFVNKLWMANGAKFYGWSGVGATPLPAGLPAQLTGNTQMANFGALAASMFLVGGATLWPDAVSASMAIRGVYVAYSYLRSDGYYGPANFLLAAKNVVPLGARADGTGAEFFQAPVGANNIGGFTVPAGLGISAIATWVAVDSIFQNSNREVIAGVGASQPLLVGNLGWITYGANNHVTRMSITLKPTADVTRFWLYTLMPPGSLFNGTDVGLPDSFAATIIPTFNNYTGIATGQGAFTGMAFGWFNTNIPKYLEVNQNSMFFAGFSNAPSNVWFSDLGAPESIQPENFFEVRTNDGDKVTGMRTYNNQEIIFKQNSFHKVIGDSPDNYALVELSLEYGCLSNNSIVAYQGKLGWLDQKGIVQYDGASWNMVSTPVEDVFRRMNLSAAKEKAVGVYHAYRNQVWWGIPVDGSTVNNLTVVYDCLVDAWTFFDGFNPSAFNFIQGDLSKPTVWRGDYSGLIYYHGESFFGDNGQGITCLAVPHWDKNKENETWIWRRFFLDVATASGTTGVITGKTYSDYNLNTVKGTFSIFQDAFQSRAEMGVVGKAATVEFSHYSASLPLLINNFSWAKRFLRNV